MRAALSAGDGVARNCGRAGDEAMASGMNTVMRTLGGALGGQISATFITNNAAHGLPSVTGFTDTSPAPETG